MFMLRKIGALLRGKLSLNQVFLAGILGGVLGFVPGLRQAPGLILSLLSIILVLNCNLSVFLLTVALAKLVSLPLMPISFAVGEFLLEGPTEPLFRLMINAPVLAWFGFEYYSTTGGVFLGLLFGIVWGVLLRKGLIGFRSKMARMEEGSEFYKKHRAKRSTRFLSWIFFGAKSKQSYRELLDQSKRGSPLRIIGVVAVLIAAVGAWSLQGFLGSTLLRTALQGGLEQSNGATVDLAGLTLDLQAGQVTLEGLAMADPNDLGSDLFRADKLQIALGTTGLLRRRLVIDDITSLAAKVGAKRAVPGVRTTSASPPPAPPADVGESSKTLEDYLADAQIWKERLQQASRWIRSISGSASDEEEDAGSRHERIADQIAELGMTMVAAEHLIQGAPLLLVRKLALERISLADGGEVDIHGTNLSTDPSLVAEAALFSIQSREQLFGLDLKLDAGELAGKFFRNRLSVDAIASELKSGGQPPMRGGTIDVSLQGSLQPRGATGVWIDLPLQVVLRDTTLRIPGMKETKVDKLDLPLGLRGPLAAPRIKLDDTALVDALVAAGKRELANQVRDRAGKILGDKLPGDLGGKAVNDIKKLLPGGLFGRKKKK